jgi:hypothetical protein
LYSLSPGKHEKHAVKPQTQRTGLSNQSFENFGGLFLDFFKSLKFYFFQAVKLLIAFIQNKFK